ncbi:DoxX family protein [Flavitalea antarctica]
MKKTKVIFWIATVIIFLFEGVMPALTSQTELAKEGIRHLGYPEYFGRVLVIFKILGVLALIIPQVPDRIKQWAYAGFAFNFIFAFISTAVVDGINPLTFFPLVIFGILIASYLAYEKLKKGTNSVRSAIKSSGNVLSGVPQ